MNEWVQKTRNVSDSNHQTSSTRCYDNNQSRLARQDLLRRRDINLYTGGLHPRLLHGQQPQISPRLSLFSNQNTPETQPSRTSISGPGPCRAFPASVANNTPQMPSPSSFLQSPCSPPPSYQVPIFFHQRLKMFLKPVWEGKMHGGTKIGVFRPLFCVIMLGKSTNYSTGTRPLCSIFWAK